MADASSPRRALFAGLAYGALLFAAGFVLGTLRVMLAAPVAGETVAVAVELPLMLAFAWLAACHLVDMWKLPRRAGFRLVMGAAGLAVLLACEAIMGFALFGWSLNELAAHYRSPLQWLGLLAQVATAAFPALMLSIRD